MQDDDSIKPPFGDRDAPGDAIWTSLEKLPRATPSDRMRRDFHRALTQIETNKVVIRLRRWLGLGSNAGWVTVAATLLLGIGVGQVLFSSGTASQYRLDSLERNVALLNRELILNRLDDAVAGKRLQGVIDAAYFAADDAEIARALLNRAMRDRVFSVRSAAINALGPSLGNATVGLELMRMLEQSNSPLVQLALVDLILRNGSGEQLERLQRMAKSGALHPDLVRHVNKSLGDELI